MDENERSAYRGQGQWNLSHERGRAALPRRRLSVDLRAFIKSSTEFLRLTTLTVLHPFWSLLVFVLATHASHWQSHAGYRTAQLTPPAGGKPGFTRLPSNLTGVAFTNRLAQSRYVTNQIYLNGSGVASGDVDGDGWCDLYFCGLDGPNVLYRNRGDWRFTDITSSAGVACADLDATGACFADLDGDLDLDLIVNSVGGGTRIFLNDGKGRFTPLPSPTPLNPARGAMSLALADIDGDGDLDLYIANYRTTTIRDMPNTRMHVKPDANGKLVVMTVDGRSAAEPDLVGRYSLDYNRKIVEHGEVDALFRNDGNGKFVSIPFTQGNFLDEDGQPLSIPPYDWGLSVMFRDINGDGLPDFYVCNDFSSPDRIWINLGGTRFQAVSRLALRNTCQFSMGVDFADLDRDGYDEIFVADMLSRFHPKRHIQIGDIMSVFSKVGEIDNRPQYSRNTLFFNHGDGTYAEIAQFSNVQASEWSWSPTFLDVDLDGYEDLLITTGHELEMMNADVARRAEAVKAAKKLSIPEQLALRKMFPRLDSPNVAFRNLGDLTFEDVSVAWGFDAKSVSHGMALADLDNDGDLDVVMNNLNEVAGVFRNEGSAPRVAVRLKGTAPNTQGIGAKIKVRGGPVARQSQEVICGGRYLSGDDPVRVFAAGSLTNRLTIEVTWRSGRYSVVSNAAPNFIYEVDEASAVVAPPFQAAGSGGFPAARISGLESPEHQQAGKPALQSPTLFQDVSHLLNHTHHEEPFDDFERQPLLPRRLSQLGPGLAWHDLDGDGREDLAIGSGRGGQLAHYRNDGQGGFQRLTEAPVNRPVTRDQTTVLGFGSNLIVGSSNYEDGLTNGGWIRIYDLKNKVVGDSILGQGSSTGPLAMGDIDADGDLDLFVGGRVNAGRYPEPAVSMLMKNEGGRFVVGQKWEKLGLVSGAVFSDLDGDGYAELILACEWGPLRIFRNARGTFTPWDWPVVFTPDASRLTDYVSRFTLVELTGLWTGVTTGDLDGDGQLDVIATNWGLNSRYRTSWSHPRKVYYGDLDGNGTVEVVESYYEPSLQKQVPERWLRSVGAAMPWVLERMGSYEAYGRSSVEEIYGERLKSAGVAEVRALASVVLLNRGGKFEAKELPREAQWSPGFGVSVGDLDGDGNEDVFVSQNFFGVNGEMSRCDGGRGLVLRGDGRGGLEAMGGQESGVKVYGEGRGCALGDYDGDGRVDLAVGQNGAGTKLYRNVGAKAGLRIRLKGGANNPNGVGAQMRLQSGGKLGPVREVKAGSGYWSQEGAVQVQGLKEEVTGIWVRWPGGKIVNAEVPKGAKELEINQGL